MYIFPQGGADPTIDIPMRDTNGALLTGLAFDTAGASCYYRRPGGSPVQITLATLANAQAAHTDGGFVEIDATNMAGMYRLDLPDAAIAAGENFVVVYLEFTSSRPTIVLILLDPTPSVITGSVNDASATTTSFVTDLSRSDDDAYNDAFILFRTGALAGTVRQITDYVGSTKTVTVDALPSAPANGVEFVIVNR